MKEIGVIVHQAKSGRLIVGLSKPVKPGSTILDEKGRKLGTVVELIGPVRSAYASVAVATSRTGRRSDKAYIAG